MRELRENILKNETLKRKPNNFGRLANHTSQTNIHMVAPKLH